MEITPGIWYLVFICINEISLFSLVCLLLLFNKVAKWRSSDVSSSNGANFINVSSVRVFTCIEKGIRATFSRKLQTIPLNIYTKQWNTFAFFETFIFRTISVSILFFFLSTFVVHYFMWIVSVAPQKSEIIKLCDNLFFSAPQATSQTRWTMNIPKRVAYQLSNIKIRTYFVVTYQENEPHTMSSQWIRVLRYKYPYYAVCTMNWANEKWWMAKWISLLFWYESYSDQHLNASNRQINK